MSDGKKFRVVGVRECIREVVGCVERQFAECLDDVKIFGDGESPRVKLERLRGLDLETCSPGDVVTIMGNESWVYPECDVCLEEHLSVLEVDCRGKMVRVCWHCLNSGATALRTIVAS